MCRVGREQLPTPPSKKQENETFFQAVTRQGEHNGSATYTVRAVPRVLLALAGVAFIHPPLGFCEPESTRQGGAFTAGLRPREGAVNRDESGPRNGGRSGGFERRLHELQRRPKIGGS